MITTKEQLFIKKYVDNRFYDQEKLIKYLGMHEIVGAEVFPYCDRRSNGQTTYSRWLEDDDGYAPLSVSEFVKRVPFYFYTQDKSASIKEYGDLESLHSCYEQCKDNVNNFEPIYEALDFMFYDLHLPLNKIFSYWIDQTHFITGNLFMKWAHYLHLCVELGTTNYFPDRFITAYNYALEASGLPAIIYEIHDTGLYEPFVRNGDKLKFEGQFPCDENGNPIMRWIGLRIKNAKNITCCTKKSMSGYLTVEINPDTVISVLNYYNDQNEKDDYWYQVYAGPLTMQLDHAALKYWRNQLGYTQKEVANAVGTSIRTYQKWESGKTTPDGYYLIRLLNWLDISNLQDITKYTDID